MRALLGKRMPSGQVCLWTVGLIPMLWSCLAWLSPSQPHPMAAVPRIHSLAFNEYVLDMRHLKMPPRDSHHYYFAFRNVGTTPLKIKDLQGSCGCLHPILSLENKNPEKILKPGESGEILLRIQAASQEPGEREYWVDVNYEDPEPRQRRVVLKMNLPKEQVWLQPRGLVFYPGRSGTEIPAQEINLKDLRGDRLSVIGVSCDDPYISYEIVKPDPKSTEGENSVAKIQVSLKGPVPAGRRNPLLKIYTDDPADQYQELRVPIIINAPTAATADRSLSESAE